MDIRCPRCAEPREIDSLHDAVEDGTAVSFDDASRKFWNIGCGLFGIRCETTATGRTVAALAEALGTDDLDGLAADLEDAEFLGVFS